MTNEEEAKEAFVYLITIVGLLSFLFIIIAGKLADCINPKVLTPIAFLVNGACLFGVKFVDDPLSFWSFGVWTSICLTSFVTSVAVDGYFAKILPKEIRGVMISCMSFVGLLGKAIALKVGGELFDTNGRNAPFVMMAICLLAYGVFVTLMSLCGCYGNFKIKNITLAEENVI